MVSTPHPKAPPLRLTRKESQQATRRALITSAIGLFARSGVSGTALNAVAEHAGLSRGAVHGNFTDKDELAAAVVGTIAGELGAILTEVLNSPASTGERLATYITASMDYCHTHPDSAAAIVAAAGYFSRQNAQHYDERAKGSADDLVALFEEGQSRGEMRSFDSLTMALALRAVLDTAAAGLGRTGASAAESTARKDAMTAEFVELFDHATRATRVTRVTDTNPSTEEATS